MRKYLIAVLLIVLAACTSSQIVTGTVRAPIEPDQVKIYASPPEGEYEEVAVLSASSEWSWAFTGQQQTNSVVKGLKKRAAGLGANGIIITGLDEKTADSIGVDLSGNATYYSGDSYKTGKAVAIYVKP